MKNNFTDVVFSTVAILENGTPEELAICVVTHADDATVIEIAAEILCYNITDEL